MRKNAPRKWLHAILDLLPVILIPVFMIYSHRHTIDSGSIQVPQNQVVDFNQQAKAMNSTNYYPYDNNAWQVDFENNGAVVVYINATSGYGEEIVSYDAIKFDLGSKYLVKVEILDNLNNYNINIRSKDVGAFVESVGHDIGVNSLIFEPSFSGTFQVGLGLYTSVTSNYSYSFKNFQLFNLTQMFGIGNEPTIEQFNQLYSNEYYEYTLSKKTLIKDVSTITYDDTDIMSQSMYQLYNSVDKYFNMNNIFNMGAVYDWFVLNVFNGNAPIIMYVVWNIALYELVMDLMFLLYALFMWFVDWCKSLIERTYDVGRGK